MSSRWIAAAVLTVVLAGCAADPAIPTSGERLRIKYLYAPDGARAPVGIHDVDLDVDCWFARAADGEQRCLPDARIVPVDFFADAECTQGVVAATSCDAYALIADGSSCGYRVAAIGDRFYLGGPPLYQRDPGGACVESALPPDGLQYLDPDLPPERFVLARDRVASGSTRLRTRYHDGADGSEFPDEIEDSVRDETCQPERARDGELRCMPSENALFSYVYSDEACASPLGAEEREPACPSDEVARYVGDSDRSADVDCQRYDTYRLFDLGPETEETYQQGADDALTCEPAEPDPSLQYFAAGDPIPPETFVPVRWTSEEVTTRLSPFELTSGDGFAQGGLTRWMWDRDRGETCSAQVASDRTLRCLPEVAVSFVEGYLTPDCADPEQLVYRFRGRCPDPAPPVYAAAIGAFIDFCDEDLESPRDVYQVGEPVQGQVYVRSFPDLVCQPASDDAEYFRLGPLVPPSAFERVEYSID